MRIDVRAFQFPLTPAIERHARMRVEAALSPIAMQVIEPVIVRLEDINADHGGIDKRASVSVRLTGRRPVIVADAVDADLYLAIDVAVSRIRRAALRSVARARGLQRKHAQRPGTLVPA
jgi:ribosome-associated translation inhibitor RaiA